jgi:hypothetical protein
LDNFGIDDAEMGFQRKESVTTMNADRENELSMQIAVSQVMEDNKASYQTIPAIGAAVADLNDGIEAINTQEELRSSGTKGVTAVKRTAREAMVAAALALAGQMAAYATAIKDEELFGKVDLKVRDFHNKRDTEVGPFCLGIYNTASPLVAALADYGTTPASLADLQTKVTAYTGTIGKPRSKRTSNSAAGKSQEAVFESNRVVLENRLDGLMVQLKPSRPVFYNQYLSARRIVDSPGGHNGKNGNGNGNGTPPAPSQ